MDEMYIVIFSFSRVVLVMYVTIIFGFSSSFVSCCRKKKCLRNAWMWMKRNFFVFNETCPILYYYLLFIIIIIKYTIKFCWHSYIKRGLSVQILHFYRFVGFVGWIQLLSCPVPVSDWVRVGLGHVLHDKLTFSARSLTLLHTNTCLCVCFLCVHIL